MSFIRGVRGAITVSSDSPESVRDAVVELLSAIVGGNSINTEDIAYAEFSITEDIKSSTPAKFARTELSWHTVPMMCYREFEFDGGLKMCIRVLVAVNTDLKQSDIKHIYLGEARKLRPDIAG